MLTWVLLSGGAALLVWPGHPTRARLARLNRGEVLRARLRRWSARVAGNRGVAVGAAIAVSAPLLWMGAGFAPAVALVAAAIAIHIRSRRRTRRGVVSMTRLAEALRAMAGDLRSGAHPAFAAESAAREADADVAPVLTAIAASARLGGDPDGERAGVGHARPGHVPAVVLDRVTTAWSLARRHGLPLAEVFEAVYRDVDTRARLAAQLDARMAGPRASALILAGLPVLGLLLGEAMGAGPVGVLLTTVPGQVALVVGTALLFGGVAWTSAITGRVLPR